MSAIGDVLDHGLFILGQEVTEFEEQFAQLCQTRFAVGVNSGTDALIMALEVLGVGPGDEIIAPSHTATATIAAINMTGAIPVLELDQGDFGLILEALYETIEYRSLHNYNQDEIEPYNDLLNNLERLDKKTLLGKLKYYGLAVKFSYE